MSAARSRLSHIAHRPSELGDMRMSISPSLRAIMSMWSRRAPRSMISPPATPRAAKNVLASMRSAMTVRCTG